MPTATADTTTPSASPTPYPQSTITVRFVGDPAGADTLLVHLDSPIAKLTADGVDCTPESIAGDVTVSEFSLLWPATGAGLPQECRQTPPTTLCFEFRRYVTLEPIIVEAVWEGGELELLKELFVYPNQASSSPTATLPGCPGLESLPSGGGPPMAFGDASNGFAPEMAPCEETFQSLFVAGEIVVKMAPGADIGPILEDEGEPPDAAEIGIIHRGWYVVAVPVGEELAKCRAYSAHPEVLIVEPNFIRILEPIPTLSRLPIGGGAPDASRTPNALYIIAGAALLAVSAAVVISQRPRTG